MQARSFFPPTAAPIIWERLKGELEQSLSPVSLSAAAKLLIFFPHRSITSEQALPWSKWATEAVNLWRRISHNSYWDSVWMCFLARLAKHDTFVRACLSEHDCACRSCSQHLLCVFPRAAVYVLLTLPQSLACHMAAVRVQSTYTSSAPPASQDRVMAAFK